ncbi:putative RNA-binding protein Luc7-like 1 isoform X2 [Ruditapes philippinarum]|uniref:putative RNA-binding protein Luc7-like 1 isoform X2 n=1 Tax=Ruditapes philippinarum TaxID=129788 RepID=UPI00295A704A|nr:putative RNA-binding protein Luc7-like 1 isoform X2 [Ruditapes philippinarum]
MSAHDQVRAMLDELMGTARDGDTSRCQMKFDDPRVCKSFLLGCCPHDILSSTRMDLGECPKYHDVALRADFETASKKKDYFYDIDAMEHLQTFISECDRKTEMYKRRLKETQEELSEEANSKAESIHGLGEEIGTKLARAETSGAEGKVEESMQLLNEVEDLKKKKALAEQEYKNSMPASSYQQQKLRVCEICSAYLGIHDNDRRLADHFGGKLHLGFITIRDKLADLKSTHQDRIRQRGEEREKQRQRREEERKKDDEDRRRTRSRSRSRRRSRSGSRSRRRRSRSRSRRSRSRSRHSRKKSRRRSRSRSRKSRSRSRKRSRRSRSRSRSRRHRSSSRSRSRHRKSRRKSRSRSRSKSAKRRSASVENGSKQDSPAPLAVEDY